MASKHTGAQFSRVFIEDSTTAWHLVELADMLGLSEAAAECDKYVTQTLHLCNRLEVCRLAEHFSRFSVLRELMRSWFLENKTAAVSHPSVCTPAANNACVCTYAKRYLEIKRFYIIGGYLHEHLRHCENIEWEKFLSKKLRGIPSNCGEQKDNGECSAPKSFESKQSYPGPRNEECRVVALNTDIYVTGGFDDEAKALRQVWKYDTRKNEWTEVAGMRTARFYHCIAACKDHIYICGGYGDNFVLNSLERYHPHYNEWVDLAKMIIGVGNAAHAADDESIYVTCGQYGYKEIHTTNKVQCYLISTDQWSILTSYESPVFFPHSEYGLSSATLERHLIILGGQTERCDSFDLGQKKWRRISNMKTRRMESAVVTHQQKIYAVGGYDYRTGKYHDTVEEYNGERDEWKTLPNRLPRPARSLGACYIFDVEKSSV